MKWLIAIGSLMFAAVVAVAPAGSMACTPESRQAARTAIDVAIAACIAEHADIQDEAELREVCKWTEELGPIVRDLLAARKRGLAKMKAASCAPDGGR